MARWTQAVAQQGAKAVWNSVTWDEDWPRLLTRMRSGDEDALRLGLQLCGVADTDPGDELLDVIAEATKTQARLVLEQGGRCTVGLRGLCSWMSAHSTVPDSSEGILSELLLRRAGVESVQDAALAGARADCLQGIAEMERRYRGAPSQIR